LLRNPDFQRDLSAAQQQWSQGKELDGYFFLLSKWGLAWLPLKLMTLPAHGSLWTATVVRQFEKIIAEALVQNILQSPRIEDHFLVDPPVRTYDPCEAYVAANWDGEGHFAIPPTVPRIIEITVNPTYPKDVASSYVRRERLRSGKERKRFVVHKPTRSTATRTRLDQAELQLQVFDHHADGESLDQIAAQFHKPKSTIQAAWEAAKRNIGASVEGFAGTRTDMAQQRIVPGDFNLSEHMQVCESCCNHFTLVTLDDGTKGLRGSPCTIVKAFLPPSEEKYDGKMVPLGDGIDEMVEAPDSDRPDFQYEEAREYRERPLNQRSSLVSSRKDRPRFLIKSNALRSAA
jgi:hypothetical protein